jgi:hypothetical protein
MMVHKYAAVRRRTRVTSRSGPVTVTRVHPDAMALARILAHGDRHVKVIPPGVVMIRNGKR